MKFKYLLFVLGFSIFFVGCSSSPKQTNLSIPKQFYKEGGEKIGLEFNIPDIPKLHIYGASCLLCYAAASAANSSLSSYAKKIDISEVGSFKDTITKQIEGNGKSVILVDEVSDISDLPKLKPKQLGVAEHDHRALKEKLKVDYLLVFQIDQIGFYRPYTNYIPTGNPVGYIAGLIYMVDLESNEYKMYEKIDYKIPAKGEWKEPPNYPGLTNSVYEAIEQFKERSISILTPNFGEAEQ